MSTVATEVELERIGHSSNSDDRTTNENPLVLNRISDAQGEEGEADHREVAPPERVNETSLAPVDSGFGAWSFVRHYLQEFICSWPGQLVAAFFISTIVWGLPNSYGVFLVKYLDDPYWSSQSKASFLLPLVGPLSSGIIYCAGPVTYPLAARFPRQRRAFMWFGAACVFTSLLGASYAKTIVSLVALQGVLYAIGGALLYAPTMYFLSEWFVARRGLALGMITAGTSFGGLLLPLILPPLLTKYGTPTTLRYLSIVESAMLVLALPFIRGRLPQSRVQGPNTRAHSTSVYLKNKTFWFIVLATLLQGLAYFIPILWLPSYASSLRLSSSSSSLALAFLNGGSIAGRVGLGMLTDHFDPWLLGSATLLCTGFAVFILWGVLSYTFAGIIVYGITYGILASGWSSLWTGFVKRIAKDDPTMSTTVLGYLMLSRGIGNILSTPISTALQPARSPAVTAPSPPVYHHQIGLKLAGGQYENVIIYAGTCFVAAAVVIAAGWAVERKYPSSADSGRRA